MESNNTGKKVLLIFGIAAIFSCLCLVIGGPLVYPALKKGYDIGMLTAQPTLQAIRQQATDAADPFALPELTTPTPKEHPGGQVEPMPRLVQSGEEKSTSSIELVSANFYFDSIGTLHVFGVVKNPTDTDMMFIKVAAEVLDESGASVATGSGYTMLSVLPAGESSPFDVLFFDAKLDPSQVKSFSVDIESTPHDPSTMAIAYQLQPSDIQVSADQYSESIVVEGKVTNVGSTPAKLVNIAVTLTDDSGQVVAVGTTTTGADDIPAGGSAQFKTYLNPGQLGGDPANYLIGVEHK